MIKLYYIEYIEYSNNASIHADRYFNDIDEIVRFIKRKKLTNYKTYRVEFHEFLLKL